MIGSDIINVDFDRSTGETLYGWAAVSQNIREGLLTDFGARVMREYFGSLVPRALGRNLTQETTLALVASISAHIDVFEPRFKVTRVVPESLTRLGVLKLEIEGEYRPRALLGDESGVGDRRVVVQLSRSEIEVAQ